MTAKAFFPWKDPSWEKQWTKMIFISLGLHLFTLALFLNIFPRGGSVKKLESAYIVDLVSSPGGGPIGTNPKKAEPITTPAPPRVEPKHVPLPRPVPEKPLQVQDQSKTLDQAMEQLRKKVQQEKSLEKTLSRLEDKLKDEQALEKAMSQIEKKKQSSSTTMPGTGPGGPGSITSAPSGSQDGSGIQFQLYYASLLSQIKRNWGLPEGLLKGRDISAVIMIQVSRSGRIEDYRFDRKSGIAAFDQEVVRTLKKSDPLPALPEGYPKNIHEIFLTFHSKDLSAN
ncbi:MAG: hypothetical protein A2Y79_05745 [Deltaproteobacteria bacterium RBG_13_43_22]|nr:MAG: hypothetical protein A2Y79_05745 [Deltaproteobacteria bacterium RBG_13_43_22]